MSDDCNISADKQRQGLGWRFWAYLELFPDLLMGLFILLLAIPFLVPLLLLCVLGNYRYRRHMAAAGRLVQWPDIEPRLLAGQGTLLLAESIKGGIGSVWWCEGGIQLDPREYRLPTYRQWLARDASSRDDADGRRMTAVEWCRDTCFHEDHGTASLVLAREAEWSAAARAAPEQCVLVTFYG